MQGARCMDCGIPFCNSGCPVNNIIPDLNDLVYRGDWKNALDGAALDQQLPRVHRPHLPGAVRGGLHAATSTTTRSASSRSSTPSSTRAGTKAGSCRSRRRRRPARRSRSSAPARPAWPARSSSRAPATTSTVFEKNDRIGGLLRYGIPDFKMEKSHIDRRMAQMQAEGVDVPHRRARRQAARAARSPTGPARRSAPTSLKREFDAVVLTGGAEQPRDLPVPGPRARRRPLRDGVPAAAEQGRRRRQGRGPDPGRPASTSSSSAAATPARDCVGTSTATARQSVTQFELLPHAAGAGEQAAGLAVLADQAAHLVVARGRLRARLRRSPPRSSSAAKARTRARSRR